jgi:two-component system NtrC family sensor kinase
MAHEVNTPLTGISSYAQLLLAETTPEDPKYRLLKKMEQQSFRASNLVNNLLDLIASRPRPREIVKVPALVTATVALHEELFQPKQISVHVGDMSELQVRGNFHDLQQVLTNVLLNARDAVTEHGNIWIDAEECGERVLLRVRDDGKGVPADLLERIFEPLVTSKRGQGGTGLGLAITRRILHASEGEISVVSTPGGGAEFTITLPRVASGRVILIEASKGSASGGER